MVAESASSSDDKPIAKEALGKVKESVGWATGDRAVEAEGEVEQEEAAADSGDVAPDAVEDPEEAERRIRAEHGDIKAEGDGTGSRPG